MPPLTRFDEDSARAGFTRAGHGGLAFTRDDNDFEGVSCGGDDGADQYVAWNVGQAEIDHDHVEAVPPKDGQRVTSVRGSHDIGTLQPEQCRERVQHIGRVFDDEDVYAFQSHPGARSETARKSNATGNEVASPPRGRSIIR